MARNSVRGTPYHHVGTGQTRSEGMRPGLPMGSDGETTMRQYRGTGMDTKQGPGTPYRSERGNSDEFSRTVEQSTNAESSDHGNQNDPASNGDGVVLDGANRYGNGFSPRAAPTLDSPVPGHAPVFDTGFVETEDKAHLGSGNAGGADDLINGGGVMSRGMVGTSKSSDRDETELTHDDTLRGSTPA